MGEPLLLLVPIAVVFVVAVVGWLDAPRAAAKRLRKLAASTGLALDDDTGHLVARRLRRRQRSMMIGMVVGSLLGCLPIVLAGEGVKEPIAWWVAVYLMAVGVGALAVHVVDTGRAAAEPGPRAAVLRPRRLHDFLYPAEAVAPFVVLVLPALAIVVAVATSGTNGSQAALLGVGAAVAILVTIAAVLAQRFVLQMAPPADSPTRLKWEDALRGIALRDLGTTAYCTSFALGGIAPFGAASELVGGYPSAVLGVMMGAILLGLAGLLALVAATETRTPARRFMRLYDDPATGVQR